MIILLNLSFSSSINRCFSNCTAANLCSSSFFAINANLAFSCEIKIPTCGLFD
jgi:hypothetical protein